MSDDAFIACRPRLLGIAYGMLGELTEAEDIVQDACDQLADQLEGPPQSVHEPLMTATIPIPSRIYNCIIRAPTSRRRWVGLEPRAAH